MHSLITEHRSVYIRRPNAPRRRLVHWAGMISLAVGLAAGMAPTAAVAVEFKVFHPVVEPGEWEFETRGWSIQDRRPEADGAQGAKLEVGYGVTSFWFTELEAHYERVPGANPEYRSTDWENVLQFTEPGQYWLNAGLVFEVEAGARPGVPSEVAAGPILQKEIGSSLHTVNLIFESVEGEPDVNFVYGWQSLWRLSALLQPGFEAYGELGPVDAPKPAAQQEHWLGPVVSGRVGLGTRQRLKYNLGYLFGLTAATPDRAWKWVLEYEF
jgi:hypothetical protein